MSDYKGYDPLENPEADSGTRVCRICDAVYDDGNFDKCPHCVAKRFNTNVCNLFHIARFIDKCRVRNNEIVPGPKFGQWYDA